MRIIASVLSLLMVVSPVWAIDYTDEGSVDLSTAGYNGPGISEEEIVYLGTVFVTASTFGFFDEPIVALATLMGGTLGWGIYRKEHFDKVYGIPSATKSQIQRMDHGFIWELLDEWNYANL